MRLLLLAVPLLLASCLATQGALDGVNAAVADVRAQQVNLAALQADQSATIGDVQEAEGALEAALTTMAQAVKAIPEAAQADAQSLVGGLSGFGLGVDGGIVGLLGVGLSWFMRDRRKRLGTDPLQRANVPTPPTT